MKFYEQINSKLQDLTLLLSELWARTIRQYRMLLDKTTASYFELHTIFQPRQPYSDDFQDNSLIVSDDGLVSDPDGYVNAYTVEQAPFIAEYYTQDVYPMNVLNGSVIPGSKFSDIFAENIGFWGYTSDTPREMSFVLDLQQPTRINKIVLKTTHSIDVHCYIRADKESAWESIGVRKNTMNHCWNIAPHIVSSIKFVSVTNIFCVHFVQAGYAKYVESGKLVTTPFTIPNPYHIVLHRDADVPLNTNLRFYICPSGQTRFEIDEDIYVTCGVQQVTEYVPSTGTIILPSDYIDNSLSMRSHYNAWSRVDSFDWTLETMTVSPDQYGKIVIPSGYYLFDNSIKNVYIGDKYFTENSDYMVKYNLTDNIAYILRLGGGQFDNFAIADNNIQSNAVIVSSHINSVIPTNNIRDLRCDLLLKKKVPVKQYRTYIYLSHANAIQVAGLAPFVGSDRHIMLRHVVLNERIISDTTVTLNQETYSKLMFTEDIMQIDGQAGTNLIEIECYKNGELYLPSGNPFKIIEMTHYGTSYNMMEITDGSPNASEFLVRHIDRLASVENTQTTFQGLVGPLGITFARDHKIYISDDDQIKVYRPDGTFIRSFGTGEISSPFSVAIDYDNTPNRLYVACQLPGIVRIYQTDGILLNTIEDLSHPVAVAFHSQSRRVYIGEASTGANPRILYYDTISQTLNVVDNQPVGNNGLTIDKDGNIYATNVNGQYVVRVYDINGNTIRQMITYGSGDQDVTQPAGIAWVDGLLYVADYANARIQIYTDRGIYVGTVNGPQFANFQAIAYDAPFLYAVQSNTGGGGNIPRCIKYRLKYDRVGYNVIPSSTTESFLYELKYLRHLPNGINTFHLEVDFESYDGTNTPTLRSYHLENLLK